MPPETLAVAALMARIAPRMGPMQGVQPKAKAVPRMKAPSGVPPAPQLPADYNSARCIDPVNPENVLRKIKPDHGNFVYGTAPFLAVHEQKPQLWHIAMPVVGAVHSIKNGPWRDGGLANLGTGAPFRGADPHRHLLGPQITMPLPSRKR